MLEVESVPDYAFGHVGVLVPGSGRNSVRYLPLQGPAFEIWLDETDGMGVRISAEKMFTFSME